jgi:hypothetical protein
MHLDERNMDAQIQEHLESTDSITDTLDGLLPQSLPLLRRLQFMNFSGGRTPSSHVLTSFSGKEPGRSFVMAYLDYSRGPETEMWLFSSLELSDRTQEEERQGEKLLVSLFRYAQKLERSYQNSRETPGILLIGTIHERVLQFLQNQELLFDATVPHYKFIFHADTLPPPLSLPSKDYAWSTISREDIPLVLSRTSIPRKELSSPSLI